MERAAHSAARINFQPPRKIPNGVRNARIFPRGARKDGRAETRTKHDYAVELIYIYESLSNRPKKMRRTETLMQQPMPQALRRYVT